MKCELSLLSDNQLNAVVGGMMNNGQGNFLQMPKNTGGPSGGSFWGDVLKGAEIAGAVALATAAAIWG